MAKQTFTVRLNSPKTTKCPRCKNKFEITEIEMSAEESDIAKGGEIPVETIIACPHCHAKMVGVGTAEAKDKPPESLN